jgi:hypothetical protein
MSWQLWVLVATVVAGMTGLFALKLRHAQEVFDRIVGKSDDTAADEVARHRLARDATRRPVVSHQPHMAAQSRRHH